MQTKLMMLPETWLSNTKKKCFLNIEVTTLGKKINLLTDPHIAMIDGIIAICFEMKISY